MLNTLERRLTDLARDVRMLAVIGAALKLRNATGHDEAIRDQINAGAKLAVGGAVDAGDEQACARLIVAIQMALAESSELFDHPDRPAGWKVRDPQLLEAQGKASAQAFARILALAAGRPLLREALLGRFLDVGTGVGGIALEAAASCPGLKVEGIDIWPPALELARQHAAASPYADRISIYEQDVATLEAASRYSLVWLPSMFMDRTTLEHGLDRIVRASMEAAYLVCAVYTPPPDPFMAVMASLRTLRGGGEIIDPAELADMLAVRGYVQIEVDAASMATFIIGRRP